MKGLSNIQNLERRRWKGIFTVFYSIGIYPPTIGHKLIKDDNIYESVLDEMIKAGKAVHKKDNFKENKEFTSNLERGSNNQDSKYK